MLALQWAAAERKKKHVHNKGGSNQINVFHSKSQKLQELCESKCKLTEWKKGFFFLSPRSHQNNAHTYRL